MKFSFATPITLFVSMLGIDLVAGQANVTGNCVSGRIKFNRDRVFNLTSGTPGSTANPNIDLNKYDMTLDYGYSNAVFTPNGGLDLKIVKNGATSVGARMSTLRYMLYGKVTFRMKSIPERGAITTGILMSDVKDEIDWEGVGARPTQMESAIFYRGNVDPRGGLHPTDGGISTFHDYTIDWTDKEVKWLLNGQVVRTYGKDTDGAAPYRNTATIKHPMQPNERIFPNTPSLIQIAVWATGPESEWGGGAIQWGSKTELAASYEWIDVQCYDDKMQPVPAWPVNPSSAPVQPQQQPPSNSGPISRAQPQQQPPVQQPVQQPPVQQQQPTQPQAPPPTVVTITAPVVTVTRRAAAPNAAVRGPLKAIARGRAPPGLLRQRAPVNGTGATPTQPNGATTVVIRPTDLARSIPTLRIPGRAGAQPATVTVIVGPNGAPLQTKSPPPTQPQQQPALPAVAPSPTPSPTPISNGPPSSPQQINLSDCAPNDVTCIQARKMTLPGSSTPLLGNGRGSNLNANITAGSGNNKTYELANDLQLIVSAASSHRLMSIMSLEGSVVIATCVSLILTMITFV